MNWKKQSPDSFSKEILNQAISHMFQMQDISHCYTMRMPQLKTHSRAAEAGVPVDMIQIDVTRTWEILGEIIGDTVQEGLINELFSQFCLGK